MDLPIRLQTEPGDERVVSVDGVFGAPGLHLSHWPGNATPRELRHDLSTGSALAFGRLGAAERERYAEGCVALANNHYDTDGACAMLAVRHPKVALERADALLAAAEAGDFFRFPSEDAFVVDAILSGFSDPERSPFANALRGLTDLERYELCTHEALERLPRILDGDTADYAPSWQAPLARAKTDLTTVAACARDELVHFDLCILTAPVATEFDPGRHALFGSGGADRVLAIGPRADGTTFRFLLSTLSWFDLVTFHAQPRPDLAQLAAELNELEGSAPEADVAWRHQSLTGASPELWFGTRDLEQFSEFAADVLRPSSLAPDEVKARTIDALRASFVFPEEDEEAELPAVR